MLLKYFLIFGFFNCLKAASLTKGIPVKVVYLDFPEVQESPRGKSVVRYLQNRNLDEKIQLSNRELKEADQHLPSFQKNNDKNLFLNAKTLFLEKLSDFKAQVDGLPLKAVWTKPTSQDWKRLNDNLQAIFTKHETAGIRQNQGGFFQELSQATSQWFQSLGANNNKPGGEEDEQQNQGGGLGQAWNNFTASLSEAFSNFTNNNDNSQSSTTSNTVLGDTGVTTSTKAPGFFQNIVSNLFNSNQANASGHEDTGVTQSSNVFQGAINNIINTFNLSSEKPAQPQDETSSSAPGNQFIQNFNNAIGQVFGQGNKPPGTAGDNPSSNKPPNNFLENIGSAFQNVFNQNQPGSTVGISQFSDSTTSATNLINQGLQLPGQGGSINNIEQVQNVGQQIVQGFDIPQILVQNTSQQLNGNNANNNQLQAISEVFQNPQVIISQGQNIGQQLSSGSQNNIGQQLSEAFQNSPNSGNQLQNIGQQFTDNLGSGLQGNNVQQISDTFQNPQTIVTQIQNGGQQISESQATVLQQITDSIQNPQNLASQAQNAQQQFSSSVTNGEQLPQNPQIFVNQAQNITQQFNENTAIATQGNTVGQQIGQAFQNPQSFATQAHNISQQFGETLSQVSQNNIDQPPVSPGGITNLNINQIPIMLQQSDRTNN